MDKLLTKASFEWELRSFMRIFTRVYHEEMPNVTPHILRHTGCTRYAEKNMDIKVLQHLMGHRTSKITNDVYNHVDAERLDFPAFVGVYVL